MCGCFVVFPTPRPSLLLPLTCNSSSTTTCTPHTPFSFYAFYYYTGGKIKHLLFLPPCSCACLYDWKEGFFFLTLLLLQRRFSLEEASHLCMCIVVFLCIVWCFRPPAPDSLTGMDGILDLPQIFPHKHRQLTRWRLGRQHPHLKVIHVYYAIEEWTTKHAPACLSPNPTCCTQHAPPDFTGRSTVECLPACHPLCSQVPLLYFCLPHLHMGGSLRPFSLMWTFY